MPKYFIDLEKSLELQNKISSCFKETCEATEYCYDCKYSKCCTFNINVSFLLRQAIRERGRAE